MNVCMVVYNLVNNGIGKVVLTYSAELVRHGHAVTVLVGGPCDRGKVEEANNSGITAVQLPDKKSNTSAYFRALYKALNQTQFDVCHIHGNSGMVFPELVVAKRSRAVAVVCHCHSTGCEHPVLHGLLKRFVPRLCDCMLACSEDAGRWLFGNAEYAVLPNSFDLSKFAFDAEARSKLRDFYGIEEKTYVIGNVARLNPSKNHEFLIDVFTTFHERHRNSILLVAGGGPGENNIKNLADSSPARDSIILLGDVADPSKLYSAMDCFVFPSIHEGLGIVLVEAQLAGLDCFVSSCVPNEACVSGRFHSISLDMSASAWVDAIEQTALFHRDRTKCELFTEQLNHFDIGSSYKILEGAYESALERRNC